MTQTQNRLDHQWDAVPAERQAYYRRVYQRELQKANATLDDAAELRVLRQLIAAYKQQSLVPVGTRWAIVPDHIRQAAREQHEMPPEESLIQPVRSGVPRLLGLLLLPLAGLVILFLVTTFSGGDDSSAVALDITPSMTATATPAISPTPTPLALEEADRVIRDGEPLSKDYYPVLLQIYPPDATRSRVFVVQERSVETADWRFDPNPDVASWVSGLIVRPVLGIPFSDENAAFMESLQPGTRFELQMNTGAVLTFLYENTQEVVRQTSSIFQQVTPGLALVLIGEYAPDGLLTDKRTVILARYEAGNEIERLEAGELTVNTPMGVAVEIGDGIFIRVLDASLVDQSQQLQSQQPFSTGPIVLAVDVEISTQTEPILTSNLNWLLQIATGDDLRPVTHTLPDEIPAHTTLTSRLRFEIPEHLESAVLTVSTGTVISGESETSFALSIRQPEPVLTVADLVVQVESIAIADDQLEVTVQLFNPHSNPVSLAGQAIHLDEMGIPTFPTTSDLPSQLAGGAVCSLNLTFPYSGQHSGPSMSQSDARLFLLEREYMLHIP
ncbi:MAG: hypothetical protein CL607_21625 [Anaerolineaceae bacterium]|nr:hypothetical protein [Anaerolineaceae bacterium]